MSFQMKESKLTDFEDVQEYTYFDVQALNERPNPRWLSLGGEWETLQEAEAEMKEQIEWDSRLTDIQKAYRIVKVEERTTVVV